MGVAWKVSVAGTFALLVSGCAGIRATDPGPAVVSNLSIDAASNCLIQALNEHHKPMAWDRVITYHVQIISPGSIYEITPQQQLALTRDNWFVKATKISKNQTRLEAFGPEFLTEASRKCAGLPSNEP